MLPNLSQGDADGCLWICVDPGCPERCAGELETEDLVAGGGPTSWGTGSDVDDRALAAAADRLGIELAVSCHGDDFAAAQGAQRSFAAAAALCGAAGHAAADAEHHLAGADPGLPGLLTTAEL